MTRQPRTAVGRPESRVDGRLKVTGGARFAADHGDGVVHAVLGESSIGRGRVTGIDTRAARDLPGVLAVIDHRNAPRLPYRDNPFPDSINPEGVRLRALQDDRVWFFGQPVAVVVATTLETARHAARLVEVRYAAEHPDLDLASVGSAVLSACDQLRRQAVTLAVGDERSPLHGADPDDVIVRKGLMHPRDNPTRGGDLPAAACPQRPFAPRADRLLLPA